MLPNKFRNLSRGFTLVELLVVIGILTILLSIALVAINPARQFKQANNAQRRSDVNTILNAVHQWAADNNGDVSQMDSGAGIPATATIVGDTDADVCLDVVPTYIAEMPYDPTTSGAHYTSCSDYNTGYTIVSSTGPTYRVTVAAPGAELGETISVTR